MSAFILALVMVLGMIPTGIFKLGTSAAEPTPDPDLGKTFLHASYAASVNVDGTQDAGYRFDVPVGAVRLGAAWNKDGLYLSFNSADVTIETLKVNGAAVDLTSAVKATDTCTEYKLPLPEDLNAVNTLSVKLEGSDEVTLQLAFDARPAPTTSNFSTFSAYWGVLVEKSDDTKVKLDTLYGNENHKNTVVTGSNLRKHQSLVTFSKGNFAASFDAATVLDVDVTVHYLPDTSAPAANAVGRDIVKGGLSITYMDDESYTLPNGTKVYMPEAMFTGIYRSGNELFLNYYDGGNKQVKIDDYDASKVQTGEGSVDLNKTYHLQIVYTYVKPEGFNGTDMPASTGTEDNTANDKVNASYYVNGKLVAKSADAKIQSGNFGGATKGSQVQAIVVNTKNSASTATYPDCLNPENGVSVTVSDLSVTKTQPAIEVVKEIASLGKLESVDADAVTELRKAYEELADADKEKVTNIAVLEAVEGYLAQVQYVHAEFSAAATTVNGALTEKAYRNFVKVNDSVKLTASWNGKYLYLGFKGTTAAVSELKLNGEVASYTSKAGTDSVEYQIALNLPDYSQEYTLSFKLGETEWSGKVVFDTVAYATTAPGKSVAYGAEPSSDGWSVVMNSYASTDSKYADTGSNQSRDLYWPVMANLASSLTADTVIEFDLDIAYLPDVNPSFGKTGGTRGPLDGGLNIALVDDENRANSGTTYKEGMWSGLYQSGGKLYLAYWDGSLDAKVGYALLGDYVAGGEYHLRIEYHYTDNSAENTETNIADNDLVSAKYYINGKLVAQSANAKRTGVSFTASKPNTMLITSQGASATNEGRCEVTVSKLYVSKTSPAIYTGLVDVEEVEQFISAIDTTVTLDSETAITKARQAYDGLDDSLKALVSNYAVLEAAESQLKVLKNSYLHAVFSTSKITVDGNLGEAAYKRVLPLGGNLNVSAAWDATNLYLAFAGASNPNVTVLKINGYNVPLTDAKTGTGTWEMAISLDSVGLGAYTSGTNISFTLNSKTWAGKLVLDTVDHEVVKGGSLTGGGQSVADKTGVKLDTYVDTSWGGSYRSVVAYENPKLASVAGANTVVEFDLSPSYLPDGYTVSTPSRAFLTGGLSFTIRDDKDVRSGKSDYGTEAFLFGIGKKSGQVYLIYWYNNGTKCVTDEVAIGVADSYHIRVEYVYGSGKEVTANYYVNGVLVLERTNSRLVSSDAQSFAFSTASLNHMQVYAGVKQGEQSETNKVVATISNISFGHTQPTLAEDLTVNVEQVEQLINEIGAVTMDRKGYIESTLARFESLSATAQKLVKNADVLKAAVSQLKVLENSFLHAAFAPVPVVVDGAANEEIFRRNLTIGSVKFGAAWDTTNLYLYFADTAAPTVDKLVINNVTIDTTGTAGTDAREIKIALADLGITNLNNDYPISIQIGSKSWSGKLVLDNVDFEALAYSTLYFGATATADKLSINLNTINPDAKGENTDKSLALYNASKLTGIAGEATVLEFGFDPIKLPTDATVATATSRSFLVGGVSFTVRDDKDVVSSGYGTKAYSFGFGNKAGELKLYYWYHDAASNTDKVTYADLPAAEQYYIRIEYVYGTGEQVAAKYYVNGVLVAESESALVTRKNGFGTAGLSNIQLYADDKEATEAGRVEVGISNLSVGHTSSDLVNELTTKVPEVEALIDAIGPVKKESKPAIEAAQAAFDALSILAQSQVSNAKILEQAKTRLQMLENSYLHAAFTYDEPTLDGRLYEAVYHMNIHMSEELKVGAAWTKKYLYLGFQSETAPTVSDLVINGKTMKITSSNSKTGATAREVRISLSSLGIVGYDKTYEISFRIGDIYWSGTLVQDSNDYQAQQFGSLYYGAAASPDKTIVTLNTRTPDANGGNTTRSLTMASSERFASAKGKISIFDLDLDIINMPNNSTVATTPGRDFVNNGITFAMRDDLSPAEGGNYAKEAFNFGFGKQNGKLKLYYWYNDANGKAKLATIDVPEATSYHLRIEFDNGNGKVTAAKYFINGILLGESDSVRVTASSYGTSAQKHVQVYAKASSASEAGRVELRLSGLSISHPQTLIIDDKSAAAYVDERINEIGTVTLESGELINIAREAYNGLTTAQKKLVTKLSTLEAAEKALRALKDAHNAQYTTYLFAQYDTKGLVIDGELSEAIWRTPQTVFGVGKLGATWDFNYLYLGFTGSKVNTLSNLKVNGKPVTDLGKADANSREIKILLSGVGIKAVDVNASYDLSFTLDGKTWSGKVVFDTGTFKTIKPSTSLYGGVKNAYQAEIDTLTSTYDGKRQGMTWTTDNLTSMNGYTTIMEWDTKINAMPNNGETTAVNRNFLKGGLGFVIRDDDTTLGDSGYGCEAFLVGLVKQKGQMKLVYWDDSLNDYVYESVEDYGTGVYHMRVEYYYYTNNDVSAKYYVNGMLVADILDAKEVDSSRSFSTASPNMVQIMGFGTEDGHVDAVISSFSVTRNKEIEVPGPLDVLTKDEFFGNLDLNHVQQDLDLPKEFVTVNGEHFDLVWSTSDSSVITSDGKVTRPLEEATSATLSLIVDGETLWSVTVKVDPLSLEESESPEFVDAAFSKAPIVIDGLLDEEGWRMSGRVLDKNKQLFAEYGFQWTQTHLYIAVGYMGEPDTLSFKLNGRYFTVQDGKLYRGGENVGGSTQIVTNGKIVEMRIPLNVLGLPNNINYYGVQIPMSIKAGPYVGNGKTLTLSNIDWFATGNRYREVVGAATKSTDSYHGVQKLVNGYRLYDLYGGSNAAQIRSYVSFMSTNEYIENFADRVYDTRIEFDFQADALPILPTDGSAYSISGGAYGVSGFTCAAGEITGADGGSLSFNYGIINTHNGLLFVLNVGGVISTQLLNKEVGDKFSIAVEWTKDNMLHLYVDGVQLNAFPCIGYWNKSAANASLVVNMRAMFAPNSTADNYDVTITNVAFGKVHKTTGILAQLTFDTIRNKNKLETAITSDLKLPTSITNGQLDNAYKITWTSSKPDVISNTGKVTRPATGTEVVTLTATLPTGESKSFDLIVDGVKVENDSVLVVEGDENPEFGIGVKSTARGFYLDMSNNSIIKILDGKQKVNFVVLTDGDDKADLTPESITLWVSDDNQTYTRIKDYKMLQVGEKWYLYDFEAEGRYVKVHYTKPDEMERDADFISFYGALGTMIDAGYHTVFGADQVTFNESTYILTNNTGKDKLDYAWTISKKDLGITGSDASIRIFADGKLLYHYVSGANVVVRVNDLPKGASVTLKVLSSNASGILDIANKEGVHEVIYGVQNTTLTTERHYYLTLPAGTTFPDGSKLETETIFSMSSNKFRTSTDGGKTWISGNALMNAPEGKTPVSAFREGGWMFDSHTGKLMFEAYIRGSDDPDEGGFNPKNMDDSHMHTIIISSDDGGKTWYLQDTMPCRTCMPEYKGDNVNALTYALSYSDGTELSTNDGKGPNVDFVFPMGAQYDNIGSFASYVGYTRDGGETWHYSTTPITYPSLYGSEGGCSEAWIIEREDGVLTLHVRCQDMSSYHFKVSYSYDHGVTWTDDNIFTDYYAVNGQAFIRKMEIAGENTVIAAWGGNTSLGSATYHRNPFVFASSGNDGETFRNIQNIYFRSFEERYDRIYVSNTTNVSLVSHTGDDLIFTYRRNMYSDWIITNVEDFDDWFTRTKGAYDNFEKGTMKGEGWNLVDGIMGITDEIARDKYALKVEADSMTIRSIPYLQDGTLSIDIYVTEGSDFTVELQSGHTRYYDQVSVPIAFRVEGGKVYFNSSTTAAADGIKEGWNTLTFDLGLSKDEATLSINGGKAVEIPLKMDFDDYINFINIGTKTGATIYLDEFLVIDEGEPQLSTDNADQAAADKVIALIKAIKSSSDTAAIKAAREAFDKLTQAQQDLIDRRVLANNGKSGLEGMINYYEKLRMYEDGDLIVENLIDAIGTVDQNSGDKLVNAEKAYKQLSYAQKQKVDNYGTLRLARLRYDRIMSHKAVADAEAAEAVQEMIDAILLSNPMRYETQIKAARTAYNRLTADQMALVTNNSKLGEAEKLLQAQKEAFTKRSLASLQQLIDSLGNDLDLYDLALVEGIRMKFNSLSAEQRQSINDANLLAAERIMTELKKGVDKRTLAQYRLEGVIKLIDSIGQVTIEKKGLIDAIRYSYDKLTTEQKELVLNYSEFVTAESLVQSLLQLADTIPNTGDNNAATTASHDYLMPMMLFSTLALAVLVIFYFKKRNFR